MKKKIKTIMQSSTVAIFIIAAFSLLVAQSCSSAMYSEEDIKMEKINTSSQYKENKFLNYTPSPEMNFLKMAPMLWDFIFVDNDRKPKVNLPSKHVDFDLIVNANPRDLKVTWVGHSSQIINIDGKIILTDPVYSKQTVFMGPSRYNGEVPVDIDQLPEIDIVLISHNHYDHLDISTIKKIHPKVMRFFVPLMVGAELEKAGVPRAKITEMNWWDEVNIDDDFMIAFTPTQHFSGRGIFDRDNTLWGSYVVKGPYHKIYFSGDSGYFEGFKEIGNKYGPFDYTFLECGAYNKKWHYVHMYPEETVQAHIDLKGKILQPIHWGTFDLALHAWYDPMIRVAKAADSLGAEISTPIIGETITIDKNLKTERWWEKVLDEKELVLSKI